MTLLFSNLIFLERTDASDDIWAKNEATIKNGETVVIENVDKTTKTDFIIEEGGTLIIKNSSLFMTGKHHHDNYIEVYGTLIIENSNITAESGIPVAIRSWSPQASIIIKDSDLIKKGEKDGANVEMWQGAGEINIIHSDITSLSLFPEEGKYNNSKCYVERSSMELFNLGIGEGEHVFEDLSPNITKFYYSGGGINVRIKDTKILKEFIIDAFNTAKKKHIVIKNSSVGLVVRGGSDIEVIDSTLLFLGLKSGESYHYKNLHPGYYEDQVIIDKPSYKIKLINSTVTEENPYGGRSSINIAFGENIVVEDCELYGLQINHNLTARNVIVKNYLQIYENERGILQFENVEIGNMVFVITADVTIKGSLSIREKEVSLCGGLKVMRVERFFPVIVRDQNGDIVPDATLTLYDSSGTSIWTGKTDSKGESEFSIVFNKNNYNKTFLLKVESPNYETEKTIILTSSTPIITNSSEEFDTFNDQESTSGAYMTPSALYENIPQEITIVVKDEKMIVNGKILFQVTGTNNKSILPKGFEKVLSGVNGEGRPQLNAYLKLQKVNDHWEANVIIKPIKNLNIGIRSGDDKTGVDTHAQILDAPEVMKNCNIMLLNNRNQEIIAGNNTPDIEYAHELEEGLDSSIGNVRFLIGGPVANDLTKKLMEKFSKEISNEYPGYGKGIIEVKKIGGITYVLLAGSDRDGTNAAVQIFLGLEELPDTPILVDWNNGNPKIVEE